MPSPQVIKPPSQHWLRKAGRYLDQLTLLQNSVKWFAGARAAKPHQASNQTDELSGSATRGE